MHEALSRSLTRGGKRPVHLYRFKSEPWISTLPLLPFAVHRCPVDPTIFPAFFHTENSLESSYEAFRFTESYGVIFQCNVKYCIGRCEPVSCSHGREETESWGRRKRSINGDNQHSDEMTLSQEILVLDFSEEASARSMTERPPSINESLSYQEKAELMDKCASRSSVMALSITASTLLVIYICTVAYFVAHRRVKTLP